MENYYGNNLLEEYFDQVGSLLSDTEKKQLELYAFHDIYEVGLGGGDDCPFGFWSIVIGACIGYLICSVPGCCPLAEVCPCTPTAICGGVTGACEGGCCCDSCGGCGCDCSDGCECGCG